MKYGKPLILFVLLVTGCRIVFTGEFNPASLPQHPAPSLPEKTFESFWQTFEDHYAFFTLRKVDWQDSYKRFRPRVTASTSDDSLFTILSAMVKPFQDDHINLVFPHNRSYKEFTSTKASRFLSEFPDEAVQESFWKMVDQTLHQNGFGSMKSAGPKKDGVPLFYYCQSENTGYIRFVRCYVTSKTEDAPQKDAALAGTFIDTIIETFKNTKQIIIDVRINEGGNDEFSYAVAGRFTDEKILGHYKQVRTGGYEDFSPLKAWYIEPQGKIFNKPVTVLTNDQTASAADVFAMIMKALPETKIIGENSMGIYSDMYGFKLPNGWYASLSNERYFSADMKCYEGTGTPVDIEVLNTRHDLITRNDPVLTAAITLTGH